VEIERVDWTYGSIVSLDELNAQLLQLGQRSLRGERIGKIYRQNCASDANARGKIMMERGGVDGDEGR
jgi:hypothetical protein